MTVHDQHLQNETGLKAQIALSGGYHRHLSDLAMYHFQNDNFRGASGLFRLCTETVPSDVYCPINLALTEIHQGLCKEARQAMGLAEQRLPAKVDEALQTFVTSTRIALAACQ